MKNLECLFLDPCNGVTCATGTVAVSALGICQCLEVRILQIRYALYYYGFKRYPIFAMLVFDFVLNSVPQIQIAQHLQPRTGYALGGYVPAERLVGCVRRHLEHPFAEKLIQ